MRAARDRLRSERRDRGGDHPPRPGNESTQPRPFVADSAPAVVFALALVLLTFGVYAGVRDHAFVDFDDLEYVVDNPSHDGRLTASDVALAFSRPYNSNWSPLSFLSLAASDALHGSDAGAYAVTNAVLHAGASVLLLIALGTATGRWPASAFVAAVFAVHPLHVESVAWISERKEVLAGFFWMAALAAHPAAVRNRSRSARALVLICGVLAMLSKPTAVALPVTLVLLDLWPLGRLRSVRELGRSALEQAPLLAAATIVAAITYAVQTEAGANVSASTPLGLRVLNAARAYAIYVGQSVWPVDLAYYYPFPSEEALRGPGPIAALAGLVATAAVALAGIRRAPLFSMSWLWFLAVLVPMIGLVRVGGQAHADRYVYVAQTGLVIALAFGLPDAIARRTAATGHSRAIDRALALGAVIVVAGLAWLARAQVAVWQDSRTLFAHAVAVDPDNAHAHRFLGVSLWVAGEAEAGRHHLETALRLRPEWGDARLVYATALLQQGRLDDAAREIERAARDGAEPGLAWAARGVVADRRGQAAIAASAYEEALRYAPDDWEVLNNLAWIRAAHPDPSLRDADQALALARRAATRAPKRAFVQGTLAAALAANGREQEALAAQERAIVLLRAELDATPSGPATDPSLGDARKAALLAEFTRRLGDYRDGAPPWSR